MCDNLYVYENTLISLFQNDGNNEKERKVRERESREQMNKEERQKEHSRDREGEEVNEKREGKKGKKKIWVAILPWEKNMVW